MGSLRSSGDSIEGTLGLYVATELRLELGCYVATEQTHARSLHSDRAKHALDCCVATLSEIMPDVSCFLRKKLFLPKIDIARINALRPQPKHSPNPPETSSTHSEDAPEPMQVDKAPMGRTLRKRKEKVAKHLKRGAIEKEMDIFLKRVLRIPQEKPFEEAYFTHIFTNQKSIDNHLEESIDSSPDDVIEDFPEGPIDIWENDYYNPIFAVDTATPSDRANLHTEEYDEDYEEERATEYRSIRAEEDRLLHYSYGIRNATSIDRTIPTSIDTHYHQTQCTRASTDIAYYTSFDNGVDHAQEGNYSFDSWADDHYHRSYALETKICEPRADEFHEGFTTEELFNHQERSNTDSLLAAACVKGTRFYRPFTRAKHPSIDNKASTSIYSYPKPPSNVSDTAKQNIDYLTPDEFGIFRDPEGYAREMDGHILQVSREDITDILQMPNGAENLFMQQHNTPEHQQRVTNEFYDTAGGVYDRFKPKYRQHTRPLIDISVPTSIDRRP
ncbi:hypothetical protein F2Q69_00053109 [Brassica cretica]|uniref:Uncharacterized protein n=1 Tax=Brassica cretica TaxID=69181 RepID=A0A8S9MRI8_BRACR|nr:hypothetical protein F2Q69_00053109 [Brassica cretica]